MNGETILSTIQVEIEIDPPNKKRQSNNMSEQTVMTQKMSLDSKACLILSLGPKVGRILLSHQ